MPSIIKTLLNKLNKLEALIRPPGSLAYNIHHLSPTYRAIFERWLAANAEWSAARPDDEQLYIALLAAVDGTGEPLPELPAYVAAKIYPAASETGDAQTDYLNLVEASRARH